MKRYIIIPFIFFNSKYIIKTTKISLYILNKIEKSIVKNIKDVCIILTYNYSQKMSGFF